MIGTAQSSSGLGKSGLFSGITLHALSGYASYFMLAALAVAVFNGGWWYLLVPVYMMVVVPAVDLVLGDARKVYREDAFSDWQALAANACPFGFIFIFCGLLAHALSRAADFDATSYLLAIVAFGMVGGVQIAMAHELVHKQDRLRKLVGRLGLLSELWLAYEKPHIYEHHRYANTPRDPGTARRGQSVYNYIFWSIVLVFRSTYTLERDRLKRKGAAVNSWRNYGFIAPAVTLAAFLVVWIALGGAAALFLVAQSFIGISFLYSVGYIEHYGMVREDGRRPRFDEPHTWETYARFSSYSIVMLQRHADHHALATRHYHLLGVEEDQPVPFGYPVMITLSLLPPLFFRLMDPRLPDFYRPASLAA